MDKINLDNFDWGWMNGDSESSKYHKNQIIEEIFTQRAYERFFEVEEGDIVFDFGSSVGPFTYSILDKKPKQVYCFIVRHCLDSSLFRLNSSNDIKLY